MKFFHIADLHLGKTVNGFSLLEDQKYILLQILQLLEQEAPDGLLIAGDVYDKALPSVEAVELLNRFLTLLSERGIPTFIISGNHDSAERLSFASELIEKTGIHIARAFHGVQQPYILEDAYGKVNLYLLPFFKPLQARKAYPEEEITTYQDAVAAALRHMNIDKSERNILMTHQFVTGAVTCESEELSVGGTDGISASLFDGLDYVALGHIHSPQQVGREAVRYAGSPLKYSFSEAKHQKSVTVIEFAEKGTVTIRTLPLTPLYDMTELKGSYDELMARSFYEDLPLENYYHITLTDEEDIPDAVNRLRTVYKKLMKLDYDNTRTRANAEITGAEAAEHKQPIDLLDELYEKQNGKPLEEAQRAYALAQIERIWEGEQ